MAINTPSRQIVDQEVPEYFDGLDCVYINDVDIPVGRATCKDIIIKPLNIKAAFCQKL
jgi:hypothetical protein